VSFGGVPGLVSETEAYGETTLVVDPARLVEACTYLRDSEGFDYLSDISPTDYLGWGEPGVSGYIGTSFGRDINNPGSRGFQALPQPKPKRFSMSYHLVGVVEGQMPRRVRVKVWLDDGEPIASVIEVWPTADFHEREAWDMMGIVVTGHPNMKRILMEDDWDGHPLRKDYPIGGEPVRFSEAE
jgi:NADH:ubiquinone oxidoreductase subunit C